MTKFNFNKTNTEKNAGDSDKQIFAYVYSYN